MKILFLSYKFYPDIGGIEVNSEILATCFVHFGAEVHLVTTSDNDMENKKFLFTIIRNPKWSALLKEFLWADAVFENNPSLHLSWPLLICRKTHVVAIHTWICRVDGTVALVDKLKKRWLKKADSVIAVSEKIKEYTFDKAIVIGNPYRSDLFKILPEIKRDKDFVFLGRLVSDKGSDMAIEVLHLLHKEKMQKYTLTIIGDGPEMSSLQNMANQYKLNNYIFFTGGLTGNKLVECLNRHKYMLIPSRWVEPFGIVALEGMACGCLPIVSDGGGLVDAVGDAGIVFERNSINSLFSKVKEVLENPELVLQKRDNAVTHLAKYSLEVIAKQYYDVILNVFRSK